MSGIFWLASYPKSGNTWLRVFLESLRIGSDRQVDINGLSGPPIAAARSLFDDNVGVEASDLTREEIDSLRADLYEHIAKEAKSQLFIKVHDAFTLIGNRPLLGRAGVLGAVYIVRNPLDVVVSLANHIGRTIDESIERLNDSGYALCDQSTELPKQLQQRLFSWSEHTLSWVNATELRLHVVRYEDMRCRAEETFGAVASFLGFSLGQRQIAAALRNSDLGVLRRMEQEHGFKERSPQAKVFFGRGLVGGYREILSAAQIGAVVRVHESVMRRFGYLNDDGELTF